MIAGAKCAVIQMKCNAATANAKSTATRRLVATPAGKSAAAAAGVSPPGVFGVFIRPGKTRHPEGCCTFRHSTAELFGGRGEHDRNLHVRVDVAPGLPARSK